MKSFGPVVDVAIPHEAGRILVGRVVGLHARGLDVEVVRYSNPAGISIGNFATLTDEPSDEAIPALDPRIRAAFTFYAAGGVAGNKFCGVTEIGSGADSDREVLPRYSVESLESVSDVALQLIIPRRRTHRQLVSLIRSRYQERVQNRMERRDIQSGRHVLLDLADISKVFAHCRVAD